MVYILLGTGFEEIEAVAPCDLLRRAGAEVCYAALADAEVTGSHGIVLRAEKLLSEVSLDDMEMLVLPGGLRGVKSILADEAALALIRKAWEAGKMTMAEALRHCNMEKSTFYRRRRALHLTRRGKK